MCASELLISSIAANTDDIDVEDISDIPSKFVKPTPSFVVVVGLYVFSERLNILLYQAIISYVCLIFIY